MVLAAQVTTADYDGTDHTLIDDINDRNVKPSTMDVIPRVNGADQEIPMKPRRQGHNGSGKISVPMHVLFNQAGRMCTRFNKEIKGTRVQQGFVQKLVSTIYGYSIPILFFHAMLFPKHFWCNSRFEPLSTLGCPPISCFRTEAHPDGFASTLDQARVYSTSAVSSTSTDDHFLMHLYSMQANAASSGIDSRLATRSGFKVSTTTSSGLTLGDHDQSGLTESLDSGQGAMNLAAAAEAHGMDLFLTYTPNQKDHPGLCHLHMWKESKEWTKDLRYYHNYLSTHKRDYEGSFEMAYTHTLTRCWLEVRKLWLQFIIYSTSTKLGKVSIAFFRDEYQDCSGNLSHIHGLVGLDKGDMNDVEFRQFVCSLQVNCVGDLVKTEEIQSFIDKGLFKNENDWSTCKATAHQVLSHTRHSDRCLRRKDHTGVFELDYECRKMHPVFDSKTPLEDEFQSLPYTFSDACLKTLNDIGLYTEPEPGKVKGTFHHRMLEPKRHLGVVHPGARENMSPVLSEHFAFTRSMQNLQVITGTNGVTRYVVKVSN